MHGGSYISKYQSSAYYGSHLGTTPLSPKPKNHGVAPEREGRINQDPLTACFLPPLNDVKW